jgi:hypothetical protein
MNKRVIEYLKSVGACGDAIAWTRKQLTLARAWKVCKRGDWMLWLLGRDAGEPGSEKRKPLVLAACECARLSLKYVKAGEERPRIAIETAEKWTRGEATIEEVRKADFAYADFAYAAYAASASAYAASASSAAYAAASASYASASYAAYAAASASYASASYASAARNKVLAQCADIVRKHYPKAPKIGAKP